MLERHRSRRGAFSCLSSRAATRRRKLLSWAEQQLRQRDLELSTWAQLHHPKQRFESSTILVYHGLTNDQRLEFNMIQSSKLDKKHRSS
jgi:hypothetical protein